MPPLPPQGRKKGIGTDTPPQKINWGARGGQQGSPPRSVPQKPFIQREDGPRGGAIWGLGEDEAWRGGRHGGGPPNLGCTSPPKVFRSLPLFAQGSSWGHPPPRLPPALRGGEPSQSGGSLKDNPPKPAGVCLCRVRVQAIMGGCVSPPQIPNRGEAITRCPPQSPL